MKQLEQKPGPKWWNETELYKAYQLREFSGILIFIWCMYYIATYVGLNIENQYYIYGINAVGLLGAILHSSSWLSIMPQLTPFNLNKKMQTVAFGVLILLWLGISALLLFFLWN